ncbi:MAG: hypothetical protein ACRDTF_12375 [Pseudonocardiaceae bacterium]
MPLIKAMEPGRRALQPLHVGDTDLPDRRDAQPGDGGGRRTPRHESAAA